MRFTAIVLVCLDGWMVWTGGVGFSLSCLNLWGIRTGIFHFGLELSEYPALSDRDLPFGAWTVRIPGYFGQRPSIWGLYCPNTRLFRTETFLSGLELSEYPA
ncbi:hypothetical protein P4670_08105, partial [Neobacillus cucumis]|nr:hypothetical protein [Neobacillus cucumis]